ncbi:MAG: glucosamine-6-phosphate deaminase [Clostridia bacterium]|nr:glucosamine-6-phosphate deaminase [Clostridia bacterium]
MKVIVCKDYAEMSRKAADIISAQLILKPDSVLGLATGSTPEGLYRELISDCEKGVISFTEAKSVNLDEYIGLAPDHPQSYAFFMKSRLFDHVDIKPENTFIPDGMNVDPDSETKRYDALIERLGGIDLQLLGIGVNGHIGFNEPSDTISLGTRRVALTESTIKANSRFFDSEDEVPKYAYSMGCGAILSAKRILLLASGKNKAKAIRDTVLGEVSPRVPASLLRLVPEKVTVICDVDAASEL